MASTRPVMPKDGSYLARVDVQVDPLHRLHLLLLADPPKSLPQVPDHDRLRSSHGAGHQLCVLVLGERSALLPVKTRSGDFLRNFYFLACLEPPLTLGSNRRA